MVRRLRPVVQAGRASAENGDPDAVHNELLAYAIKGRVPSKHSLSERIPIVASELSQEPQSASLAAWKRWLRDRIFKPEIYQPQANWDIVIRYFSSKNQSPDFLALTAQLQDERTARRLGHPPKAPADAPERSIPQWIDRQRRWQRIHETPAGHELNQKQYAIELREQINDTLQATPFVFCCGGPDLDARHIVADYAFTHRSNFHTIAWIDASTPEQLTAGVAALASTLDLPEAADLNAGDEQLVAAVRAWLGDEYMTRWLLIFDGVNSFEVLERLVNCLPVGHRGRVLVTTTLNEVKASQRMIVMPKTEEAGARMVGQCIRALRSNDSNDVTLEDLALEGLGNARHIARALNAFPPDLAAAAKFMVEQNMSLDEFAGFRDEKIQALIHETESDAGELPSAISDYLRRLVEDLHLIGLKGIPSRAELIHHLVPLTQVYIPLRFHPRRQYGSDYRVTQEELAAARARQAARSSENPDDTTDRFIFAVEQSYARHVQDESITLFELGRRLNEQEPFRVAVIQGYPGMGKSTMLSRVVLHLALVAFGRTDAELEQLTGPAQNRLSPIPIPILLSLSAYSLQRKELPTLTLRQYFDHTLRQYDGSGVLEHDIGQLLNEGLCLVMFDGLDEASVDDPRWRAQVQEEIRDFISHNRANQFLITSRVAGFDHMAFPDYPHYLIADLDVKQIEGFLPRWSRATVMRLRNLIRIESRAQEQSVAVEADRMARELEAAILRSPGIRTLAENPLLLTLMAIMHINGIELPEHRADLYEVVSTMLLNTRDRAKGLKHIEVTQALDLLGPLAYQMQENDNNIARYANVIACFSRIIAAQTGGASDSEWVKRQAEHFLQLVRDRSGLFVIRVADFFGFFHRSFQEYFAARHILQQIQREGESALDEFVARVRRQDDLWREPFLLAVGYVSKSDETLARRILTALLEAAREDELPGRLHAALLAATCVLEAVPFSIDTRLKERIAHELLSGYAEAQRAGAFERCAQVEDILTRWLRTVGAGYQQPVPLSTLDLALRGVAGLEIQRAALTILSLIAQNLGECHERVFETLVPTLRGLTGLNDTGLNGIGPRRATTAIAPATDCLLADLALTALSYLGPKGPAGAYLAEVREHFASNPDQWQLLARYSLECRVLLSFAEVPAEGERFTRFETAIERWIALRDRLAADGTTKAVAIAEPDVTVCREILVELLECAEETCYPEAMHLLAMLRASVKQPDRPWRAVWKDYLVQHLHASSAVTYQVAVLLWTVLFPHQVEQEAIADRVMRDYRGGGSARPFAQHLIALLVNDLTEPTELRNLDELHYLIYLRDLSYRRYLRDISNMPNVRNLRYLSYLRRLRSMEQLRFLSLMRHQRFLRYKLLTIEVAELAMHRLATASAEERTDLLAIVLGRILQIRERRKTRTARTEELNAVARIARETLGPSGQHPDSEALHAIREMLRRHSQEQGQEQPRFDPLTSAGALRLGTQEVERHLAALAREVHQKGLAFDLLLLGEPALLLSDVGDRESIAVIETYFFPDYVAIPEAAAAVARAHGLPNGWLTSALAGFTYIFKKEPPRQLWRTFPGLRVFTPTLEYVLVMKVMASRPRDDADIAELMAKADITQAEQLIALMREYIPDEHLTPDLLHEIEDRFVR